MLSDLTQDPSGCKIGSWLKGAEAETPMVESVITLQVRDITDLEWGEGQRIDAFELWCWRRLFQVFWIARISNKLILKENQPWISTGRTDAEAEALILWPPDANNWLIGKDPYAGKDWRWESKGTTEDEIVGWYHWLNGHEFEQTLGVGDGQGSLVCCSPWGRKESDTSEWLNWTYIFQCYSRKSSPTSFPTVSESLFFMYALGSSVTSF